MIDYAQILTRRFPKTLWEINGDTYEGLTWKDDTSKPEQSVLDALWPEVQDEIEQEIAQVSAARDAAIAHAKSLGFTDEMIAVMYPGLSV